MTSASTSPRFEFFRHHGVWAPGVRLFRRLRFLGKAALICAVFVLVLAQLAWLFLRATQDDIAKSRRELVGLAVARDLMPVFHQAQRLRGRLHASGGPVTPEARALIDDIESRLGRLEASPGAAALALAEPMKFVRQAFEPLKQPAGDGEDAFGRADGLVQQLQRTLVTVADHSGLSMDPDAPSYHLGLASLQEVLEVAGMVGRVGDLGGVALERKELGSFGRRIVQGDTYVLYKAIEELFARYERVAASDEQLKESLAFQGAFDPVNAFLRGVRKSLLPDSGPKGDAAAFGAAAQSATDALSRLAERSQAAVGLLVEQRIARLEAARNAQLAAIAIGLLLAAYLFYCFFLVTRGGMRELTRHIEALAAGDLTTTPRPWGRDEAAEVMHAVAAMQESLRALIGQVRACADEMLHASAEVASGAEDLSQRTELAAGRLQQTAATMDSMARSVQDTGQTIAESAQLGQGTSEAAVRSQQVIGEVVGTMHGIEASSRRVGDILGVIDGIAFQTNILALNAAVEAARAGEHGRGFAVVAGEVRALAQRSAAAAREIKGLIAESAGQTAQGTRAVDAAGGAMDELLGNIRTISERLQQVRSITEQQSRGVVEVSASVAQLDADTQRNAALVEQTSAAALSMKSKAAELAATAARFTLPSAGVRDTA
ncbi:methyl-accepting chemotaxis protein [Piscinibacter defluvii]|uniref:methyl-accepting chemotaxis protein n=1 Tax=Piscinibacter defluvii TaxID=1796922 RepID=UPI000FDEE2E1|nr:methyl-accepting chemotaxis protein [Piscinibacter defluvii]